ncbi:annexin Gh1-like [Pyrus x bretschneideri]|uniref:annexin Gh1-like n=1 Tax=Pyrus x bretschneideri TaxID=225117 RepID=UPI00203092E7|nr:annexin Gh1-like [Pyrus x bretschneideri]
MTISSGFWLRGAKHRPMQLSITAKKEFGSDINKDLKADPNEYLTKRHEKVIDEGTLTGVVDTRAEVDMKIIKDLYHKRYSVPLYQAIKEDTNGDYEKMLLALVRHEDA